MANTWKQIKTVTAISLQSLPQRLGLSAITVLSVALVVGVLLGFLSMAKGFQQTVKSSGAKDIAVVLRSGSQGEITSNVSLEQVRLLSEGPGVARDADSVPQISPEIYVIVDGVKRSTKTEANLPLRGLTLTGVAMRKNVRITQGRMFEPGMNEIVVGRSTLGAFEGFEPGKTIRFGTREWKVVGVFEAEGTVFESELWADLDVVQSLFNRQGTVQTVRLQLENPDTLPALQDYSKNEPRLQLDVNSEETYFAEQSSATADIIFYLGWPLAIAMAFGALAGAMNAMYNSVSHRTREIVTLRTLGFSGFSAFAGTMAESVALAGVGGIIGSIICYFFFDGITASTLGSNFAQIVFRFELTPSVILQGLYLALAIGILGGFFPARRAAKMALTTLHDA